MLSSWRKQLGAADSAALAPQRRGPKPDAAARQIKHLNRDAARLRHKLERADLIIEAETPYRDGTTHVVFEPEDFLSRPAALVPSPRVNLTRFHGVFAPHHGLRSRIVAGGADSREAQAEGKSARRSASMGWAQRLKRVFAIDVERCERCGAGMKIIAAIEEAQLIEKILQHVQPQRTLQVQAAPRAPPLCGGESF